jgi:hypothetical protein
MKGRTPNPSLTTCIYGTNNLTHAVDRHGGKSFGRIAIVVFYANSRWGASLASEGYVRECNTATSRATEVTNRLRAAASTAGDDGCGCG